MAHFDETSRWMEWSKNEFSHRLPPEPTPLALAVPLRGSHRESAVAF